ncbi:hypothetical protein NQ317_005320 [Molorchus minor]|uniref:Retrotransposon gag domain-containing protein n=1 Tax=Molorchus minor TaxID=1323400 RepID=A0ABQ9JZE4_9CUCU|nr:hypothetical protein NQ317_005320 [Molorchus minor]
MSINYDIEPIHLRTHELNYELRIRNVATDRVDVALKRKYLKRELRKDLSRPDVHLYATPNFNIDLEKRELNESIKTITDLVNDYDGVNSELGNRMQSRIYHILGRLSRIPEDLSEEISNYRGDNIVIVSALEEELTEIRERSQRGEELNRGTRNNDILPGGSAFKPVPVFKWSVKFNGRGSVNSFLQRVEELRVSRKCTKEGLFEAASDLFEDDALEWFRAQLRRKRFDNWESLVSALKNDFLSIEYDDDLWKQIERRTQHENEPVVIYISVMENLFECLTEKPSEQKRLNTLLPRVLPCYQSHLALQEIVSVSRLTQICRTLEESEKSKKLFKPPPSRPPSVLEPGLVYNSPSEVESGTVSNFRGQVVYKTSSQEWNSWLNEVWNFYRLNLHSDNCIRNKVELIKEANTVLVKRDNDNRPYVSVQIFGRSFVALLDSGASHSVIGGSGMFLLQIFGLSLQSCVDQTLSTADGKAHPLNRNKYSEEIDKLPELYKEVRAHLAKAYRKNERTYNLRKRPSDVYHVKDKVWKKNYVLSNKADHFASKLAPKYVLCTIRKVVSKLVYELDGPDGKNIGRFHVKDLKPYQGSEVDVNE